jgi:hypothetical protein
VLIVVTDCSAGTKKNGAAHQKIMTEKLAKNTKTIFYAEQHTVNFHFMH